LPQLRIPPDKRPSPEKILTLPNEWKYKSTENKEMREKRSSPSKENKKIKDSIQGKSLFQIRKKTKTQSEMTDKNFKLNTDKFQLQRTDTSITNQKTDKSNPESEMMDTKVRSNTERYQSKRTDKFKSKIERTDKPSPQLNTSKHRSQEVDSLDAKTRRTDKTNKNLIGKNMDENSHHEVKLPPRPPLIHVLPPDASDQHAKVNLPLVLKRLLDKSEKMHPPEFKFDVSPASAEFNFELLKSNNFNFESLLNRKRKSITSYGSEFKSIRDLQSLLGFHPRWPALKERLSNGVSFPISKLEEFTREKDVNLALKRGNHKSASVNKKFLADAFQKEIKKGWLLAIPSSKAENIPGLELAPLGVANQLGVNASGSFVEKFRVTHDLSFPQAFSNESINSRTDKDQLEPCMFGHALIRVIHSILHLRQKHPNKKIWIRKEDFKSAYRRLHLNANTVIKSAVQLEINETNYVLLSLRLPFGGSACASDFCVLSEIITDTINDLINCEDWDPHEVCSEFTSRIPPPIPLPEDIPYASTRSLSVQIPDIARGKADNFIDDIISCVVDKKDNLRRIIAAPCTVIHAMGHSPSSETFIPRQDLISDEKNEAEGAPEEIKICLGWSVDSRRLLVSLPSHKFKAWTSQIDKILSQKSVSDEELRSILGRLEHVAIIISMFAHFFNNIRSMQIKASRSGHNAILTTRAKDDLKLSKIFLEKAHKGISMNLISFREPTHVYIGDASEHGLGGFADHGRAWRFEIPLHLRGRAHINLLEYITQVVCIWVDICEKRVNKHDCLLSIGDSTSAMGWLRRSNFREKDESDLDWLAKQSVSRKLANLILESETLLYKQWLRGEDNVIADSLSRDVYFLSPKSHENFLISTASSQLPPNFRILPLQEEICCFISSTLQALPVNQQRWLPQKASDLAHGNRGCLSSIARVLKNRSSSEDSQSFKETLSFQHSPKPSGNVLSLHEIKRIWWKEQSKPPSHLWLRPFGQTTGQTQDWTKTEELVSS
jgi:hypothetical protein